MSSQRGTPGDGEESSECTPGTADRRQQDGTPTTYVEVCDVEIETILITQTPYYPTDDGLTGSGAEDG